MQFPAPKEDFSLVHDVLLQSVPAYVILEAVKSNVFDLLEKEPMALSELAKELGFIEAKLGAVLDLLEACNLVEKENDAYANTTLASEYLVSTAPLYQGGAMGLTMQFSRHVTGQVHDLLTADEEERRKTDDEWATIEAMEGLAQEAVSGGLQRAVSAVCSLPDFNHFERMADLGGNHGNYTMSILAQHATMRADILELPHVARIAEERCAKLGYGERVKGIALDMRHEPLPEEKYDLLFASHALYSFQGNIKPVLKKIANSLRPGGWFAAHHYARTGSSMGPQAIASLEILTKLVGYFSHYLEPDVLEQELRSLGFDRFNKEWTDNRKSVLLFTAQKQ